MKTVSVLHGMLNLHFDDLRIQRSVVSRDDIVFLRAITLLYEELHLWSSRWTICESILIYKYANVFVAVGAKSLISAEEGATFMSKKQEFLGLNNRKRGAASWMVL
jgi:hypothetical protein